MDRYLFKENKLKFKLGMGACFRPD